MKQLNSLFIIAMLSLTSCKQNTIPNVIPSPATSVYLANNPPVNMADYVQITPAPPNYGVIHNVDIPKSLPDTRMPTIKHSEVSEQHSIVSTFDLGGQFAFNIPNSKQNGIYANNSVYGNLELNSSPDNNLNVLYSPTVHAPNSCLEASTSYWRGSGANSQTAHYVRLYDFCNDIKWNTGISLEINESFASQYIRNFNNQSPEYTMEITGSPEKGWSFLLFNYLENYWDKYYTSASGTGTYNGGKGWSLLESHYTRGKCTVLPLMQSNDMQILSNNHWQKTNYTAQSWGECFEGSNPTYHGKVEGNNWSVTSSNE